MIFSNNPIFNKWNDQNKKTSLIKYLLPTEDLEDMKLIKSNSMNIEKYDFEQIIKKYYLQHSIATLIFKNDEEIKVLSKINIKDRKFIKNNSFKSFELNDDDLSQDFIKELKDVDLISDFSINKFNKNFIYYEILFNGTPKNFINIMNNKDYNFDTQKKIWILK